VRGDMDRPMFVGEYSSPIFYTPLSRGNAQRAMCGRLRVGKKNLHLAALVGAAMCSAFVRGTHDRWP
jgi:hypothetical protein